MLNPNPRLWTVLLLSLFLWVPSGRAAIQFDVFLGYDDLVREGNWFPVACEIHNDGPGFTGVFELTHEQLGRGQVRRVVLELPTNTRKRFVIPVFSSGGGYATWNARLLDEKGRKRGEHTGLRPRRTASWQTRVMGALPRAFGGLPRMPDRRNTGNNDLQPQVARLQADYFPDNAIALEGLDAIYLHAEQALNLDVPQVNALMAWLVGGGHLIVGVDQPTDANALPWLRSVLPAELTGVTTVNDQRGLEDWLKSRHSSAPGRSPTANPYNGLSADPAFEEAEMPVLTATLRDGRAVVTSGGRPMVIEAPRGRGRVSLLTFSPEREPFRSWKNRDWFWARVTEVPPLALAGESTPNYSYQGLDGIFGAMVDSRQVRKLPVSWLLVLLVVYLLVIGPGDQYSLKKLNKQMLTWITFPCYVVGFSLLIYWIGFLLRAGETEWNELHVVDVIPRGESVDLRGRTFGSVYSPSNQRYLFAAGTGEDSRRFATLRGEYMGSFGGGQETSRGSIEQRGDGFEAEVFVPVWTSQLYVSDWLQPSPAPLVASITREGQGVSVKVENNLPRNLTKVRLVLDGRVHDVGDIAPNSSVTRRIQQLGTGRRIQDLVSEQVGKFQAAIQQRRQAFGDNSHQFLGDSADVVLAASFLGSVERKENQQAYNETFVTPTRFDLSDVLSTGQAVVLAWDAGGSLIDPLNQFNPRRQSTRTLLRLAVPVNAAK